MARLDRSVRSDDATLLAYFHQAIAWENIGLGLHCTKVKFLVAVNA
jgi:hypothetical protein